MLEQIHQFIAILVMAVIKYPSGLFLCFTLVMLGRAIYLMILNAQLARDKNSSEKDRLKGKLFQNLYMTLTWLFVFIGTLLINEYSTNNALWLLLSIIFIVVNLNRVIKIKRQLANIDTTHQ